MAKEVVQMFEKLEEELKIDLESTQKQLLLEVQGYNEKLDEDLEYELKKYYEFHQDKLEKEKNNFIDSLEYMINDAKDRSVKLENVFLSQKVMILEKLKEIVMKG